MEATMPFIALCTKNIHFEEIQESHELNESILSSNKSSDAFYHDSEISMIENPDKFKTLYKKQLALTQEISNQLNLCKIQLKFEIDRKEGQENRFVKAQQEFEEARKRFQNRENSVLKLMDSKDNEINEALNEITRLKALNRALEGDKKQFTDFSSKIQAEITSVKYNELKQELLMTKTSLEISEKRRAELQKELESIGTEWEQNCEIENDSNKELEKANQDLKEEIEKLKSANHTLDAEVSSLTANKQKSPDLDQEITVLRTENTVLAEENEGLIGNVIKLQEQMKVLSSRLTVMDGEKQVLTSGLIEAQSQLNIIQSSFLHLLIQDTLRKFNFQGNFTKIQNNLYSINSKEFYLQAHNNQVVVKIGASLVPLEEFLQLSHPTDRTLSFENEESISSHHILTFFSPPSSNSNTPRTTYDRKSSISTVETFKNNENEVKSKSPLSSRFIKPTISSQYKTRISLDKSPLQPRNSKSAERKRPFK